MPADLHIHTTFSDGTNTPEEIVEKALQVGLTTIAISDHDTTEGIPRALEAAARASHNGTPLEILPAVEMSAETQDNEVHILGYLINWEENWLRDLFKDLQARRRKRIDEMVSRLNQLGIPLQSEQVFKQASTHSIGRPHVARALMEGGFVANFQEAFNKYLAYGKPAYVKGDRLTLEEAIKVIRQAGGIPVLAHPGVYRPPLDVPSVVAQGLDGIEVIYNEHNPEQKEKFATLCQEQGLLVTGGSDYHGDQRPHRTIGSVQLPDELVTALKAKKLATRKK